MKKTGALCLWFGILSLSIASSATAPWKKQAPIPTWFSLQGVSAISATECWIASAPRLHGVAVGEAGNILRTSDGGTTWQMIQAQVTGQRLWDVEYSGADTVFLAGDKWGVISRSINGGATWNSIQSGIRARIIHSQSTIGNSDVTFRHQLRRGVVIS